MTINLVKGLIELLRPLEWSKTFGNMIIGALLATMLNGAFDPILFFVGFVAVGPMLWGGLYALNDWTDWEKDLLHAVKKKRPIPRGHVHPKFGLLYSILLIIGSFLVGIYVLNNHFFVLCLIAMLVNQFLYTLKPFNLKKRPGLDLISGSVINPIFRFFSGWVLFQPNFAAPIEILIFIVGVQFGGYTLYRMSSKKLETKLKYNSTIVMFGEKRIKLLAYLGILASGVAYVYSCFTALPIKFIWLAILSILTVPFYLPALTDPQKMNMEKMYKLIYFHYIFFILGFIILYFLF